MLRFILWAVLAFSLVRLVRNLLMPRRTAARPAHRTAQPGVLVQDKVCGTFVDRSRALVIKDRTGEEHYFCSDACRRKAGHT